MRTIIVKLEEDADAALLLNILKQTKFKSEVETFEEEDDITDQELKMLEERWVEYERNPSSAISINEFKKELKDKYGL